MCTSIRHTLHNQSTRVVTYKKGADMVIAEQSKMRKAERIVARTSAEQKTLIEQAANLQGITVSE